MNKGVTKEWIGGVVFGVFVGIVILSIFVLCFGGICLH